MDYKDENGKQQQKDVYSEILYEGKKYNIIYLTVGNTKIINNQDVVASLWDK